MLTKFIPFAVLIGAPILSNASPLGGWGVTTVTATLTIFHCPTVSPVSSSALAPSSSPPAVSSSAPVVSSSPAVSSSALASVPSTSPIVLPTGTDILTNLNQLIPLLDNLTSLVSSLLNTVTNIVSPVLNILSGLTSSPTGQISQVQTDINNLGGYLSQIVTTLNGLAGGAASATSGGQIYNSGNTVLSKLTTGGNNINSLLSTIQKYNAKNPTAKLDIIVLSTPLQNFVNGFPTWSAEVSSQCDTTAHGQALNTSAQTVQALFGQCLLSTKTL
ncbi:hypothetical protein K438DRAFT_1961844 [Mycena galopus ATCC 62051]|nr:hypothetical protein K438DRAFT_1961844 [Mycena galopus ATCC 62051]